MQSAGGSTLRRRTRWTSVEPAGPRSNPRDLGLIGLSQFLPFILLHTTSVGLGVLRTAPGIGAAMCALVLSLSPLRHRLVQLETPDDIRGRVSAVNAVFIGASNELSGSVVGL